MLIRADEVCDGVGGGEEGVQSGGGVKDTVLVVTGGILPVAAKEAAVLLAAAKFAAVLLAACTRLAAEAVSDSSLMILLKRKD